MLVPYLPDQTSTECCLITSGIERTFDELWSVLTSRRKTFRDNLWNEKARLHLLDNAQHEPGLRWEIIDLGCRRGSRPRDIRHPAHPAKSPHAGILAAAVLHTDWITAMDGKTVPHVCFPGYQLSVFGYVEPPVPNLGRDPRTGEIMLSYGRHDAGDPAWAVPEFILPKKSTPSS